MSEAPVTPAPKLGIKELKEVIVAANEIALIGAKLAKDGLSLSDAPALFTELMAKRSELQAAIEGIGQVAAEVKDVDLQEGIEIAMIQIAYLPKLAEALKK